MSLLDRYIKTCFSQISLGIMVMENGAVLQTLFDILKYFRIFTEYMSIFNYFFGSDLFSTGWRLCFDILLELISSEPKQEKNHQTYFKVTRTLFLVTRFKLIQY